jgi:cell division inhibitor SepF
MRQSNPVIINLQQADRELQRRMIDFCSGIAYALQCDMERVADQVFLLTPTNVTVSQEERARLESRGFNS